ncbi:glycosyltransferase [Salegentibacter flavus]|uniref:Glycosyltransferase involved in cell wall bisynthesis n=1 Tax=Salegentibacter flavus TaxID=287099 RepID=A0A1I4Y638_9FLAO|nr:glycosyltransferase [Salegentibacter flavus]SFN33009.1 Glycosyltransferase involved in cell wall bisynthesis [Salegentibacter flavus]
MKEITVSIFMLTYNQENFIAQAIEGVLMQKTSFVYQLVIGEDCSTDKTREICKEYATKFPEKIKLLLNEKNIGLGANYVKTYAECTGKYLAICDGDDYWIDPLKLQKQVDFLEKNPDYKIIYTNNYSLFPSGKKTGPKDDDRPLTTVFMDLVTGNYIASVSSLFKNVPLTKKMEHWIPAFPYADWPTYLLVLNQGGKIYFLNEPTAVYRKDFGTSTALRKEKSKLGEINLGILKNLYRDQIFQENKKSLKKGIINFKTGLMASYNKERRFFKSITMLFELIYRKNPFFVFRVYLYSLKRILLSNK